MVVKRSLLNALEHARDTSVGQVLPRHSNLGRSATTNLVCEQNLFKLIQ